jgi:CDGSH-type Zn-finger protein
VDPHSRHICDCGKTLNQKGFCDGSHDLTDEQYAEMKVRMLKRIEASKQRREDRKRTDQDSIN